MNDQDRSKTWGHKLTDIGSPVAGVADKLRVKVRQLYAFLKGACQEFCV